MAAPLNVVWSPNGETLFVTLSRAASVHAFDRQGRREGAVGVGAGPAQLAITPDGVTLVTANRDDSSVSLIDAGQLTERHRIPLTLALPME